MTTIPSQRQVVNTTKRTLEAIRLAREYGLFVPPGLDSDVNQDWETDCVGGWLAVAYQTSIIHAGMRCGKCWECVVYRFDERANREAGIYDLTAERFEPIYELAVPAERWPTERSWMLRNGHGWRGWTDPDSPIIGGYSTVKTPEIVRESNYAAFSLRKTYMFLHTNAALLEPLPIWLPRCRSGGTFQRSDLRVHKGGAQIRPTPSRKRFLDVMETLRADLSSSLSLWDTEQLVARFRDEATTQEAVRRLRAKAA